MRCSASAASTAATTLRVHLVPCTRQSLPRAPLLPNRTVVRSFSSSTCARHPASNTGSKVRKPPGASPTSSASGTSSSASSSPSSASTSSSSSSTSSDATSAAAEARRRQTHREWLVVGITGGIATVGLGWYLWRSNQLHHANSVSHPSSPSVASSSSASAFSLARPRPTTFSIPVRTLVPNPAGGPPVAHVDHKIITAYTPAQVDEVLRSAERSVLVDRPAGSCVVARYDTNSVASNDPIEDRRAEAIVERNRGIFASPKLGLAPPPAATTAPSNGDAGAGADAKVAATTAAAKGDLAFFAVMDGHAGWQTSQLLSQRLIASVALELDRVFREKGEYAEIAKAKASMPSKMWRALFGGPDAELDAAAATEVGAAVPAGVSQGLEGDPELVKRAIAKAFLGLDRDICKRPVEMLREYELGLAAITSSSSGAMPGEDGQAGSAKSSSGGSSKAGSLFGLTSLFRSSRGGGGGGGDANASHTTTATASGVSTALTAASLHPSAAAVVAAASTGVATPLSAYETLLPALSGSCALLTYVDSARRDVYVACTGDSRAVAGWWNAGEARWEVDVLSVDQTGRAEGEVKRMRSEHPADERDTVIMRGRVLGGLEPTRAFGDARYKWDRTLQERLYDAFVPGGREAVRGAPRLLKTPPYVTARPEVQWRRIKPTVVEATDASSNASVSSPPGHSLAAAAAAAGATPPKKDGRELRFIVMATDGLWDMLSNEQVVSLVAGHLSGLRGDHTASSLHATLLEGRRELPPPPPPPSSTTTTTPATQAPQTQTQTHPLSRSQAEPSFTFVDENLSTHLVRNALGGANRERVQGLLAIPAPLSRRYRDDITVSVILFHPQLASPSSPPQPDAQPSQQGGPAAPVDATSRDASSMPKAKL